MSLAVNALMGVYFIGAGFGFIHSYRADENTARLFSIALSTWLVLVPAISIIVFSSTKKSLFISAPFIACLAPFLFIAFLTIIPSCGSVVLPGSTRVRKMMEERRLRVPRLSTTSSTRGQTSLALEDEKSANVSGFDRFVNSALIKRNDMMLKRKSITGVFGQLLLLAIVNFNIGKESVWRDELMRLNDWNNFHAPDLTPAQAAAFPFMYHMLGAMCVGVMILLILSSTIFTRDAFMQVGATRSVKENSRLYKNRIAGQTTQLFSNQAHLADTTLLPNAFLLYSAFASLIAIGVFYIVTACMMFTNRGQHYGIYYATFTVFTLLQASFIAPFLYAQLTAVQLLGLLQVYNYDLILRAFNRTGMLDHSSSSAQLATYSGDDDREKGPPHLPMPQPLAARSLHQRNSVQNPARDPARESSRIASVTQNSVNPILVRETEAAGRWVPTSRTTPPDYIRDIPYEHKQKMVDASETIERYNAMVTRIQEGMNQFSREIERTKGNPLKWDITTSNTRRVHFSEYLVYLEEIEQMQRDKQVVPNLDVEDWRNNVYEYIQVYDYQLIALHEAGKIGDDQFNHLAYHKYKWERR